MPDDRASALVAKVAAFHITERTMKSAQAEAEAALAAGSFDDAAQERYVRALRRYFEPFEREARAHLRDVDRRLEGANQVVFNLTAERGVAVKRIEATQSVLAETAALEGARA